MSVINREAAAVFMAFQNVMHDAVHNGLLTNDQVFRLLFQAGEDTRDLLSNKEVEVRGHEGKTLSLDSAAGRKAAQIVVAMAQLGMDGTDDPSLPKATVTLEKKVVN